MALSKPVVIIDDSEFKCPLFYFDIKIIADDDEIFWFASYTLMSVSSVIKNFINNVIHLGAKGTEIKLEFSKEIILILLKYLSAFDNEEKKKSLIEVKTVMDLADLANHLNITNLLNRCAKFIAENFNEMTNFHGNIEMLIFFHENTEVFTEADYDRINEYFIENLEKYKNDPMLLVLEYDLVKRAGGYYWPNVIELLNKWFQVEQNLKDLNKAINQYSKIPHPSITVLMDWAEKTKDSEAMPKIIQMIKNRNNKKRSRED
jgi:hypothetical protein